MFGNNAIVGKKFFRESPEARDGKLLVTSIFRTIQGEGPFAGMPAVFVRLTHCNLQCSWCDTFFDAGDWMGPTELMRAIYTACGAIPPPHVLVITGGEPTLQLDGLRAFIRILAGEWDVQIESNGILPAIFESGRITVVVSPKCSGTPEKYALLGKASLAAADCLKFVLSGDSESPYFSVPDWALAWRAQMGREVYVSPMAEYAQTPAKARAIYEERRLPTMGDRVAAERVSFWEPGLLDMVKCRRNYEHAAAYALEHSLRLTVQMQLFASLP